ncbi:MAG TPA: hypothetical protein DCG72_13390 [Gammaproteobacteria bacterium]|nr:hypothetical protein [Gammaproteobacteria bacterium]
MANFGAASLAPGPSVGTNDTSPSRSVGAVGCARFLQTASAANDLSARSAQRAGIKRPARPAFVSRASASTDWGARPANLLKGA